MKHNADLLGRTILLLFLLMPVVAYADPIYIVISPYPYLLLPVFLVAESAVMTYLVWASDPHLLRFILMWTALSAFTFSALLQVLFFTSQHSWLLSLEDFANFASSTMPFSSIAMGEAAVIVIEAFALYVFLRWKVLARRTEAAPSLGRTLGYSCAANLVSGLGSLLCAEAALIVSEHTPEVTASQYIWRPLASVVGLSATMLFLTARQIWLTRVAARIRWWWGLIIFFLPLLGDLSFAHFYWKQARSPLLLTWGSFALIVLVWLIEEYCLPVPSLEF